MIVGPIKKLDLLKSGWTWEVTGDSWMHGQEEMHSGFLRSHNEELGETITCFLFGPDILVPLIITGILQRK